MYNKLTWIMTCNNNKNFFIDDSLADNIDCLQYMNTFSSICGIFMKHGSVMSLPGVSYSYSNK